MLRGIGALLIISSALGVLNGLYVATVVLTASRLFISQIPAFTLSFIFAACGLASGIMLFRKTPTKRSALFWIAAWGAGLCVSLLILAFVPNVYFELVDGWWPPKDPIFFGSFWNMMITAVGEDAIFTQYLELFRATSYLSSLLSSPVLWVFVPLGLCLWALFGRAGGWADKAVACVAIVMAILTTNSAIETALLQYGIATYEPPDGSVVDFAYYPQFDWYVFYAIEALMFVAMSLLLFRRKPRLVEQRSIEA